jgi:hypothetical protein
MQISHMFTVAAMFLRETSYYSHLDDMSIVKYFQLIIIKYTISDPFNIRYSQIRHKIL